MISLEEIDTLFTTELLNSLEATCENNLIKLYLDVYSCLKRLSIKNGQRDLELVLDLLTQFIEYTWERIHSVYWKDVKVCLRDVYALGIYLKLSVVLELNKNLSNPNHLEMLITIADKGILLGSIAYRSQLQILIQQFSHRHQEIVQQLPSPRQVQRPLSSETYRKTECFPHPYNPAILQIESVNEPSLVAFLTQYMTRHIPVVLKGCMSDWPAFQAAGARNDRSWGDLDYIKRGKHSVE